VSGGWVVRQVAGGVVLKHVPPAEARKPDKRWRLYIFKNDTLQDEPLHIHRWGRQQLAGLAVRAGGGVRPGGGHGLQRGCCGRR
jgi:hypothetical protein